MLILIEKFSLKDVETVRFHQRWRAGEWTIEISDFPVKTSIPEGFSITMFDCERVMMEKPA